MIKKKKIKEIASKNGIIGDGTKTHPFVFTSFEPFEAYKHPTFNIIHIFDCDYNMSFNDLKTEEGLELRLKRCHNVSFHNCDISALCIYKSSNIKLMGVKTKNLRLTGCNDLLLKFCESIFTFLGLCYNIKLLECTFTEFKNSFSRGNLFKNTIITVFNPRNLIEGWEFKMLYIALPVIFLAFISAINAIGWSGSLGGLVTLLVILGMTLLFTICLVILIMYVYDFLKIRKFPPNEMISE